LKNENEKLKKDYSQYYEMIEEKDRQI